jgi:dolichol-phosphate mannosyltransferase
MKKKDLNLLSIIIPVHNEQGNIAWHHEKIIQTLKSIKPKYEIIYVDDGSTDTSLALIKELCAKDIHTRYISFSRNFGKEAAITAGMHKATGDAVFVIDSDGQHPIEMIQQFIDKWYEGYEVIIGVRENNQGEGLIKSAGSKLFYLLLKLVDGSHDALPGSTDFRLIDRSVVDQYNLLTERNRISRNLMDWLGFKKTVIPFNAHARHSGKATYSYRKLVKLAIDGAITHSTRPLKLIGALGLLISSISFVLIIFLIIENYLLRDPLSLAVTGTAFLAIFLSFLIGIVLACQGLLALYIENIYYEAQNRPLYIIREDK